MKTVRIPIDGGKLVRSSNGTIRIGSGKLLTWLLLIGLVVIGLCCSALVIDSWIHQGPPRLSLTDSVDLIAEAGTVLGLGFGLVFVLRSLLRPVATLDPAARLIVRGKGGAQKIPFTDVAQILISTREGAMEDVLVGIFSLCLKNGTTIELGSVSGDPKRLPAKMETIRELLAEALAIPAEPGEADAGT